MPLRDPFHPPLKQIRHGESFHAMWAGEIVRTLNRSVLPKGCFAETQTHVGSQVEIDIATFEHDVANGMNGGGVAVAASKTSVNTAGITAAATGGGLRLVGAIELVSPGNKDRPETRQAFVARCAAYLQQGIGSVVVDVVTERLANLHNELVRFLNQADSCELPSTVSLYTTAYRPRRLKSGDQIELWLEALQLELPLPIMPLGLRDVGVVPVDLEGTYQQTCKDCRL